MENQEFETLTSKQSTRREAMNMHNQDAGEVELQTAMQVQPTQLGEDIGNKLQVTIMVTGNKDMFKYCILFGKYSYIAEGKVSINHQSNECILIKDNNTKLTEAVAELQAVVEAFGWIKLIKEIFNFDLPKTMILIMKREFIVTCILQNKLFKGPLCRDKQLLQDLYNSLEMTKLTYQKYDTQNKQSNTRGGLCKNWVQLVNGSYCMPEFKLNLLQNASKNDMGGKREVHEYIAKSNKYLILFLHEFAVLFHDLVCDNV